MAKPLLYAELQKANRRIKALEKQMAKGELIYVESTRRMIETLKDKAAMLTGVTEGNLRVGKLKPDDRGEFIRILQRFNRSQIGTRTGQRKLLEESKRKFEETYGRTDDEGNVIPMSEQEYETLTSIFESDQFTMFKEKYGTYSGVIAEMAEDPLAYDHAMEFIENALADDERFTNEDGSLDVEAFIEAWKGVDH